LSPHAYPNYRELRFIVVLRKLKSLIVFVAYKTEKEKQISELGYGGASQNIVASQQ